MASQAPGAEFPMAGTAVGNSGESCRPILRSQGPERALAAELG